VNYLNGIIEQVPAMDESFQLVVLEVIRKVCRANPLIKSQYAKCVFNLLTKSSNAVAYEGMSPLLVSAAVLCSAV
jgi:coatomer subunit beta